MFDKSVRVNGLVSQTASQKNAYLIRRNGIFYFSRPTLPVLQTRFNKERGPPHFGIIPQVDIHGSQEEVK